MRPHRVAVEVLDDRPALLDRRADEMRDRRLAGPGQACEPEREAAVAATLGVGVLVGVDVLSHLTP